MSDTRVVRQGRQRWQRSAWAGGGAGMVLQFWMLTTGTGNLFRWERSGDFYDVQARALLHGSLAVDERVLGIESFARDDQTYMYFGPVPALLRLPVIAVTNRLDGQLSASSMLIALTLILAAAVWLGWRLRHAVRSNQLVDRSEAVAAFFIGFGVVGASSLVFASSRTWVYHEAIMWGVALTLWSWIFLLRWLRHDGARWLAAASIIAALAMLTRPSVGGAAVAALGWVLVRRVVTTIRTHDDGKNATRRLGVAGGATLLPVAAYATVNWLKFRQLFSVPFEQQGFTLIDPQRQAMLAANNGKYFSVANAPTNLAHYLRPDSPRVGTRWPFIHFRPSQFTIGDRTYDLIDATAGIPVVMPIAVLAGVLAIAAFARTHRSELTDARPLLAGGVIGTFPVLGIAYVANRYHSDFYPLLLLLVLTGVPAAFELAHRRSRSPRIVVNTIIVLTLVGALTNTALAYTYQRAYSPNAGSERLAGYVDAQRTVGEAFGDGRGGVSIGAALPAGGQLDDVFIVGECEGLYWSDGQTTNAVKLTNWNGIERINGVAAGTITFDDGVGVVRSVIATTSDGSADAQLPARLDPTTIDRAGRSLFVIVDHDREVLNFGIGRLPDGVSEAQIGPDVVVPIGEPLTFGIVADPRVGIIEVAVDGQVVLASGYFGGDDLRVHSAFSTATASSVAISLRAVGTPLCDQLLRDPLERLRDQ